MHNLTALWWWVSQVYFETVSEDFDIWECPLFDTPFTTCCLSLVNTNVTLLCYICCTTSSTRKSLTVDINFISLAIDLNSFSFPTINSIYCKNWGTRMWWQRCISQLHRGNDTFSFFGQWKYCWQHLVCLTSIARCPADGWGVQLYTKERSFSCFEAGGSLFHSDPQEPAERHPVLT